MFQGGTDLAPGQYTDGIMKTFEKQSISKRGPYELYSGKRFSVQKVTHKYRVDYVLVQNFQSFQFPNPFQPYLALHRYLGGGGGGLFLSQETSPFHFILWFGHILHISSFLNSSYILNN